MRLRRPLIAAGLVGALMAPMLTSAHTIGASWNVSSGPYTVDIGYTPTTFTAGEYSVFDFLLWKGPANTGESADYAQIWVRILQGDESLLATGLWKQPVGPTTLLYQFAEPGSYKLEASYRDQNGNDIAVASIPITVNAGSGGLPLSAFGIPLLALLVGAAVGGLVVRARMRR